MGAVGGTEARWRANAQTGLRGQQRGDVDAGRSHPLCKKVPASPAYALPLGPTVHHRMPFHSPTLSVLGFHSLCSACPISTMPYHKNPAPPHHHRPRSAQFLTPFVSPLSPLPPDCLPQIDLRAGEEVADDEAHGSHTLLGRAATRRYVRSWVQRGKVGGGRGPRVSSVR